MRTEIFSFSLEDRKLTDLLKIISVLACCFETGSQRGLSNAPSPVCASELLQLTGSCVADVR